MALYMHRIAPLQPGEPAKLTVRGKVTHSAHPVCGCAAPASSGAAWRSAVLVSRVAVCASASGTVQHYPVPGLVPMRGGGEEAVVMHVYIRTQQAGETVLLRGFMFADSLERDWYSLLDGYVCQPDVPREAWPGVRLRW